MSKVLFFPSTLCRLQAETSLEHLEPKKTKQNCYCPLFCYCMGKNIFWTWIDLGVTAPRKSEPSKHECEKYRATLWHSNLIPRYLPNRNENMYPHKDSPKSVYSSFTYKSLKLETAQVSINSIIHCGIVLQGNTTEQQQRMNYWHMKQHGWNSKTCCIQEALHKREHTYRLYGSFIWSSEQAHRWLKENQNSD